MKGEERGKTSKECKRQNKKIKKEKLCINKEDEKEEKRFSPLKRGEISLRITAALCMKY